MVDSTDALRRTAIRVTVISLLIDLLAFTLPLPLFPRLIEGYIRDDKLRGSSTNNTLLPFLLSNLAKGRNWLISQRTPTRSLFRRGNESKQDIVLLGGLLGSLFSGCQWFVSPYIGRISDRIGRRRTLLITLLGNIASATLWLAAGSFEIYALSRIVGGLSEGNAQLALLTISDVTTSDNRARALALVGLAFASAFTVGPPLGAYLATRMKPWDPLHGFFASHSSSIPALLSLALLLIEVVYVWARLPETRPATSSSTSSAGKANRSKKTDAAKHLETIVFHFLFIFSGLEFTLTFLTFDLLSYTNVQNGKLLGLMGLLSSIVQGGVVRRKSSSVKRSPLALARSGINACILSLLLLAALPYIVVSQQLTYVCLFMIAATIAWSSATVVNSLNAMASLEYDAAGMGQSMGEFRSRGQAGRALGPIALTAAYWLVGPTATYISAALLVSATCARALRKLPHQVSQAKKVE